MTSGLIFIVAIVYLLILFAVAYWGDLRAQIVGQVRSRPVIYSLSLAVYCTSWTFYGAVGTAARDGISFLAIYIGPMLVFLFAPAFIEKLVQLSKTERITTIADFIASRYGKDQRVAALATLIAVIGTVPYISLQLKAIATSVTALVSYFGPAFTLPPLFGDLALVVAVVLGLFTILFGTRHADATEHQSGLVLAVAMESIVKLVALLAIGIWVTFFLFEPGDLLAKALDNPHVMAAFTRPPDGQFFAALGLSALAIVLLPRQFHMTVVENRDPIEVRRARWIFPLYLLAINLFVIPIAAAGIILLGSAVDADFYVLTLPLSAGSDVLAIVAFIGGLSAATAMVIVASVALSIMVSNDLVLPTLFQRKIGDPGRSDATRLILNVRRSSILAIVFLAYVFYRLAGAGSGLSSIGLLSFSAIAQLAPPLLLGLFWRRAHARGAIVGLVTGILAWSYTLLLPTIIGAPTITDDVPGATSLVSLFPVFDPLLFGSVFSLTLNTIGVVVGSLTRRATPLERIQASVFTTPNSQGRIGPGRMRAGVTIAELKAAIARYLGADRTERSFETFGRQEQRQLRDEAVADTAIIRFSEQLLASAIGSASSRLVLSLLFQRHADSSRSALRLLDDASEALQYNRDLLRIALDQVDQGLAVLDADFRLTFWNRQFRDLLSLPPEFGQVGTPITAILDRLQAAGEIDQRLYEKTFNALTEPPVSRLLTLAHSDRVIEIRANPMPQGGIVATVSDITERVRQAAALREMNETLEERVRNRTAALTAANDALGRARRDAEAANLGKTRFLAAAGHDILQPLNAARLYTSALQERFADLPGAEMAGRISSSLEAVETIIEAVLDISRLEAGGLQPRMEDFELEPLLRQVESDMRPLAAERGLSLKFVPTSLSVHSDRALLRRLIQNLVSNAVKYTRTGKVVVGVRHRNKTDFELEVVDSGIGIPADKLDSIYTEFVRLDEGSRTASGLGLGLSIVDRIARTLDLPISVRSIHGRGTRFRVALRPAKTKPRPAPLPAHEATKTGPGAMTGTVVVSIDNEAAIREGMRVLLSGWGCTVLAYGSAAEAVTSVQQLQAKPDVALIDYHLDNGTGLQAADMLRSAIRADLPIVLVTADRSPELREAARAVSIEVLSKPLKPAALRAVLRRLALQPIAAE